MFALALMMSTIQKSLEKKREGILVKEEQVLKENMKMTSKIESEGTLNVKESSSEVKLPMSGKNAPRQADREKLIKGVTGMWGKADFTKV